MVQLIDIFGNRTSIKIISFFIERAIADVSQTEIRKKTRLAKATCLKWANYLVKADILICKKIGATNQYRLNSNNLIVKQIKIMTSLLELKEIEKLKQTGLEIYLYGSCARGENSRLSDIDILVVGDAKRDELVSFFERLSKKIGKKVNFNIFTSLVWSMMKEKDNAYYERVEKDKMRLL